MTERERAEGADRSDGDREHDHQRRAVRVVKRDHQKIDQDERERERHPETAQRLGEILLLSARVLTDLHDVREMKIGDALHERVLHRRERRSGCDVSADVDDGLAVHASHQRARGFVLQNCHVAEMDDVAVAGSDRNLAEESKARLVGLREEDLDVLDPTDRVELGRQGPAERTAHRLRSQSDVGVERARAIAVELDVDLRRE